MLQYTLKDLLENSSELILCLLCPGLIDAGESVETAALRELKEETGYTATIKHVSPGK